MKIKFFSFGRSAVLFTLAVLLAFVFNACSGGAGSAIDDFTADGDYYNNGNGNSPIIVSYPNGTSGTGWVSNGSASTTTKSNASNEGSIIKLNTAKQKAADSQYSAALNLCDEILATDPNYTDAQTLRDLMARILELKELIASKKAELADVVKQIADLDALIAQWEKKVADLKKVMEQKKAAVDAYDLQIADLKGQIAAETDPAKKAQLEAQLAQLEALRESAWQDYLQAKKEYDDAYAYLQELYQKRKELIARKEALEKEIEALEAELKAKEKAAKKIQTVSTGTGDYPYTQHWIVPSGTKVSAAYRDVTNYLKEGQEYLVTGFIGEKEYTEDDQVYMKVKHVPTDGEKRWSPYWAHAWEFGQRDGTTGFIPHGGDFDIYAPGNDPPTPQHPRSDIAHREPSYRGNGEWYYPDVFDGATSRTAVLSRVCDAQYTFDLYKIVITFDKDGPEEKEIEYYGEYRTFIPRCIDTIPLKGSIPYAGDIYSIFCSRLNNNLLRDVDIKSLPNKMNIMIYAKDSQIKRPQ